MQYQLIQADLGDVVTCDSIITSDGLYQIKKFFFATVLLNPFHHNVPFAPLPFLNNAGIHSLFVALSKQSPPRFFLYQNQ